MEWTSADILTVLYIVVAVLLIIVLYHVLFIVVDLRRTVKRVESISQITESAVMKPLAMADRALDWALGALTGGDEEEKHPHKHHHGKAHHEHKKHDQE